MILHRWVLLANEFTSNERRTLLVDSAPSSDDDTHEDDHDAGAMN